jgi:hypothetical protein
LLQRWTRLDVSMWALGALAVLMAGCASSGRDDALEKALATSPACCAGPREFRFDPATIGQRVVFTLDERSPVHAFPRGRSFFKALALPESPRATFVTVASFPVVEKGSLNEWRGRYFAPSIVYLDANFEPSQPFDGPPNFMFNGNGRRFSAFRAPVPPDARYLVVFTEARLLGGTVPVPVEFAVQNTQAIACDISGKTAGATPDPGLFTALCGLSAGLTVYTAPATGTWNAAVPYSAGGNLELWLSGPEM